MPRFPAISDIPPRLATGGFILHTGLEKWGGDLDRAKAVHGMATGAYPFLEAMPPEQFLKVLAGGEIATGALLLAPFIRDELAGLALVAFSGSLLGMYWRTEAMHKPGSIWPTQAGTAVSKDVWMLGIGIGLVLRGLGRRRPKKH